MQVGFGYTPAGSSQRLSQIIRVKFGSAPGDTIDTPTAKDPVDGFIHGTPPASVELFYKVGPGATTGWPTPSKQWVTDNTRMYVLQDSVDNGLYWVVQMVVPVKQTAEANPVVTGNQWLTPGVYLGDALPAPTMANPNPPTKPFLWADIIESLDPNTQTVIVRSYPGPRGFRPRPCPTGNCRTATAAPPWARPVQQLGDDASGLAEHQHLRRQRPFVPEQRHQEHHGRDRPKVGRLPAPVLENDLARHGHALRLLLGDGQQQFDGRGQALGHRRRVSIAPYGSQAGARSAAWAPLNKSGNKLSCTTTGANATCTTPFDTQINATSTDGTATTGQFTLKTTDHWAPDQSYLCA